MASLYADENFPHEVVELLRELGHDVLTALDAGQADNAIPDIEVLAFAASKNRTVLTLNRWDFVALHRADSEHAGVVVCSVDSDPRRQAQRIHDVIESTGALTGQLLRVNRPSK